MATTEELTKFVSEFSINNAAIPVNINKYVVSRDVQKMLERYSTTFNETLKNVFIFQSIGNMLVDMAFIVDYDKKAVIVIRSTDFTISVGLSRLNDDSTLNNDISKFPELELLLRLTDN